MVYMIYNIYLYTYTVQEEESIQKNLYIYIFRSKTLRMASSFGMDIGDEDNAYGLVRTLKTKLRGIVKKGDRCEVHLTNYPESPSDLPIQVDMNPPWTSSQSVHLQGPLPPVYP